MEPNKMKRYIGDSIYLEDKQDEIILTTENGYGPTNTIILDVYEGSVENLITALQRSRYMLAHQKFRDMPDDKLLESSKESDG